MRAEDEFVIDRHNIGWCDPYFIQTTGGGEIEKRPVPVSRKLLRPMSAAEIERELQPGLCTLSDVLAFLDGAPQKTERGTLEFPHSDWNLFLLTGCVVGAFWSTTYRYWYVNAWSCNSFRSAAGESLCSPAPSTSCDKICVD